MSENMLTLAVPVFNESESLEVFHQRLGLVAEQLIRDFGLKVEILYVDDGSSDGSVDIVNRLPSGSFSVKTICFSRNFGKEAALVAAIECCKQGAIVFLDSDGQHPPEMLLEFVRRWKVEGNDVVYAVHNKRQDHPLKQKMVGIFYRLINAGSRFEIPANAADYKLLSPRALEALKSCQERVGFLRACPHGSASNKAQLNMNRKLGFPARPSGTS